MPRFAGPPQKPITELEIDNFHTAVAEFKTRVPELAAGLLKILAAAHQTNKKFQAAFADFFTLCQQNPNIRQAAVDEMLVQHLLTERLIRKIFDNPGFKRHLFKLITLPMRPSLDFFPRIA